MALVCRNLLALTAFDRITLVAGEQGLDRLITWPYIKQTEDIRGWINGGEIVFAVEQNREKKDAYFENVIRECNDIGIAALVFFCQGECYVEHVPQGARELADKFGMPLFEMPSDLRMIDVTKEISSTIFLWNYQNKQSENFLMELIHEDYLSGVQNLSDGIYYGFEVNKPFFMGTLCDKNMLETTEGTTDTMALQSRYSVLTLAFSRVCQTYNEKSICCYSIGTYICYLTAKNEEIRKKIIDNIKKILQDYNHANQCSMTIGYSLLFDNLVTKTSHT